jgi:hypothetical protein
MRTHAARAPAVAAPVAAVKPVRAQPTVRAILRTPIQPKLDPPEREADRVAEQVMRMPADVISVAPAPPQISCKCTDCEEEAEKLQKKSAGPQSAAGDAPAIVHETLRSPGQPLDAATRDFFEPRFGRDFGRVRVHAGTSAEQSARDVNAYAYTVGHNVVFGAGRFAPGTHEGRRLLAHELTHVVQQGAVPTANAQTPGPRVSTGAERAMQREVKPSHQLEELARTAIDGLDDEKSKIVLSAVLNAKKLSELPAFATILKAKHHETYGDYFIFLITELEQEWGSRATVSILQLFADAGVDITKQLPTYSLEPLAAVAKFKSLVHRYKALVGSGKVPEVDKQRVSQLIAEAEMALRGIERPPRKPGVQVKQMGAIGGVATAATWAWRTAGALAVDDVTGIGVADDVAIPFVIIAAAALSAIALFSSAPKPEILDYGPAKAKVEAALREMTDLLGISIAIMAENVADTGIMGEVHELIAAATAIGTALTICAALEQLMAAAKQAADTARINKIKATQKAKGCRHSRHSQ